MNAFLKNSLIPVFLFLILPLQFLAQSEILVPLRCNPQQVQHALREREFAPRAHERTLLTLPFLDDFDVYSLPTNDPNVPPSAQRWMDNYAYINNNSPLNPPTIGVATLDGLLPNGWAADFQPLISLP